MIGHLSAKPYISMATMKEHCNNNVPMFSNSKRFITNVRPPYLTKNVIIIECLLVTLHASLYIFKLNLKQFCVFFDAALLMFHLKVNLFIKNAGDVFFNICSFPKLYSVVVKMVCLHLQL